MIPKIIHFVWVGNNPKPELVLKCIASWKRYCPDYEIREWGNEDVYKIDNQYVKQAFENRKYAFVSDYIRLYALNTYGGFYVDTDLEITAPIDKFRDYQFVIGYEIHNNKAFPMSAFIACVKNNKIISDLLKEYDYIPFIVNGVMDQTTNVVRMSKYFSKKYNLKEPYNGDVMTVLEPLTIIFPSHFFCTPVKDKDNYAIHYFTGSWVDPYIRKELFTIGNYKVVKFKRRPNKEGMVPLFQGEKKIFEIECFKKKYCILFLEEKQ